MATRESPAFLTKYSRAAGVGFLIVGVALFLFASLSYLRTMDQPAAAEQNQRVVRERWQQVALDTVKSQEFAHRLATSSLQLTEKNLRIKLALAGTSLLLACAGGLLWLGAKQ